MDINLSKEKIALFDSILTCMRIAIKNSSLFPPGHPSFDSSMNSFKAAIDRWLISEERLTIGISSDNILLNGEFIKDQSDLYKEVAGYLHPRGLVAISFLRQIDIGEISQLFAFLKNDAETLSRSGGLAKNIPASPHLIIKETDYSSVLTSASSGEGMDEKLVWRSLAGIDKDLSGESLPGSKVEFIKDFLKDPKRSAHVINKMYREALAGLHGRSSADEIKDVLGRINRYFEEHPGDGVSDAKKGIAGMISNLDPMLVASLFKAPADGGAQGDLSEELFRGMGDEEVADFIVSLIESQSALNENFIKLFNKLSSKKDASGAVNALVADQLFDKGLVSPGMLSELQLSIKDLFNEHPENDFIAQIYKMTVGMLIDEGLPANRRASELSSMTKEYGEYIQEENLKHEKIDLILNILWYENDPAAFQKTCALLRDSLRGAANIKYINCLRETFELFTGKLKPEALANNVIAAEVNKTLDEIGAPDALGRLISFIAEADDKEAEDIIFILTKLEDKAIEPLVELLITGEGGKNKEKISRVLFNLGDKARSAFGARLDGLLAVKAASFVVGEMRNMLSLMDAESARSLPAATIGRIFDRLGRGFGSRGYLRDLIKLCGDFKVRSSVPYLGKIVARRRFFNSKSHDLVRVEAVAGLGRIGTPEALECVRKSSGDRSKSIRAICKVVLRP